MRRYVWSETEQDWLHVSQVDVDHDTDTQALNKMRDRWGIEPTWHTDGDNAA